MAFLYASHCLNATDRIAGTSRGSSPTRAPSRREIRGPGSSGHPGFAGGGSLATVLPRHQPLPPQPCWWGLSVTPLGGCGVSICSPYLRNAFSFGSSDFSLCWKPSSGVADRSFTFPETPGLSLPSAFFQQKPPASLLLLSRKQLPWETAFAADHCANHCCDGFPSVTKPLCSPCTTSVRFQACFVLLPFLH